MTDLENTLSGILSDPEAVKKLQSLGKSLGLMPDEQKAPATQEKSPASSGFDLSALSGILNSSSQSTASDDEGLMQKLTSFLPIISRMNTEDEATALLNALRPFLSREKCRRLDDAAKILRVMRILPFIRNSGLI
ncbi:MAG: hypothetical protein II225_02460 [Ruminococcus sp.]|nr:hypothetical protein [Ruminococcus sp.]